MKRESGFVIPVSVVSITVFLLVIGVMLTIGLAVRERSRIQAAVDLSILTSVGAMCPTRDCFLEARSTALTTLKANIRHPELDAIRTDDVEENGYLRHTWETEHFTLTIQRGRWKPLEGFESLEDAWQKEHPGLPAHGVLYAIKISLDSRISPVLRLLSNNFLTVHGGGIGLASLVDRPCVAPFAIPICTLFNQSGDFDRDSLAHADRLFTGIDRLRGGTQNEVLPSFDWTSVPESSLATPNSIESLFSGLKADYRNEAVRSCIPPKTKYDSTYDQFGVVGLPGDRIPSEGLIQSLLTGSGCVPAMVGQEFKVLSEGLSTTTTRDLLWQQITNAAIGATTDLQHRPLSELIHDAKVVRSQSLFFASEGNRIACEEVAEEKKPPAAPFDFAPYSGNCNSMRSGYGRNDWNEFKQRTITNPDLSITCPYQDNSFDKPYWKIQVPVIADEAPDAAACAGILEGVSDPSLDSTRKYSIVGFVTVGLFDLDMGEEPPTLANFPLGNRAVESCSGIAVNGTMSSEDLPLFPFTFRNGAGDASACNVVRARVDPEVRIVAGSRDAEQLPVIVE